MNEFQTLLKQTVERLFIVVWPPEGEEKLSDVDISIGFVFVEDSDHLYVVSTNNDDLWSPIIRHEALPSNVFAWASFGSKIEYWMNLSPERGDFDTEYYEVTNVDIFENIASYAIHDIEFVAAEGHDEPFGVKLIFENDYILSFPITDGNTIVTSRFNTNNTPSTFEHFGAIEYRPLKP